MEVLRSNRESLMAILEAFVYDPLVYWKISQPILNNQKIIKKYSKISI